VTTLPATPAVSVVMPTFNRRSSLPRMLEPLLSRSEAHEIVVVVDGCDDGSLELLRDLAQRDPRLRPLWIDNRGMGEARLAGARLATGEIVLLLDDDVLVAPGTVRGHGVAHAAADHLVVVGAMPVAGGAQTGPGDYPRVIYANEYRRHTERWRHHPETVLTTLWAGNLSLPRADLLALGPSTDGGLARGYHSDVDFGLRCLRAGLAGVYDPSLVAEHLYKRSRDEFLRDARNSGRSRRLLHESHPRELGPFTEQDLLGGLPAPLRPLVRMSRTRRWPAGALDLTVSAFGAVRLYRPQRGAAYLRKRMEQIKGFEEPAPAAALAEPPGSGSTLG
jgi:glycosyltransferase involved in cell wall biosynthesis